MLSLSPAGIALAVLVAGLAGGPAQAQPAPPPTPAEPASAALEDARRLYVEGNDHYSAGRYTLAAERFIKAYELSGKPALLFNLANTYERAGNYVKAAHYLRMYLSGGEVHDAAAVKARLQRLELAVIEHSTDPDSGTAGAPSPASASVAEHPPAPVVAPRPSRAPYYLAGGGLVAGAAAGVVFGLLARSERTEIDALCAAQDGGVLCPPAAEVHLANERRHALFSDIGLGVAAASVATGLVYYLVTRGRGGAEARRPGVTVAPSASADGVGVVAVGRF